jgi:hypothetical protein
MAKFGRNWGSVARHGICCAVFAGLIAQPRASQAELSDEATQAPSPTRPTEGKAEGRPSSTLQAYRWVQVISGSLFAVSYLASVVTAVVFHDEDQLTTERRHIGYLAYPVAGPFISLAVFDGAEQLFIPFGIAQGLGALGLIVGTIGAGQAESSSTSAGLQLAPMATPDGAALVVSGRF